MKSAKRINALLVEIMIVVLFFALCSAAMLEIFTLTRNMSREVEIRNSAMVYIQNIAERMYTSDNALSLLEGEGFYADGDNMSIECDGYSVSVSINEEETDGGLIFSAEITAVSKRGEIAQIPCTLYIAGEGR